MSMAIVTLMLATSASAYSGTANGGNGGLGSGMGTGTHGANEGMSAKSYNLKMYGLPDETPRTNANANKEVSVYGTGTGSQFWDVNGNPIGTANRDHMYRTQSVASNDGYRAMSATTDNGKNWGNWGWLGLLGLVGLFGNRNRNPERHN
ncbi:WGxxGxxG-CTERM domain-containing protein [Paenibacillus rhizovicinus]|uniref:WGxxGxxG-CTERM domain-containing protein n=1 Tax=Paenibacillus rhizovicinus TaxID=2704463 RepID=A0A6C0NTP7_9BACL|nr:WGxxGxxG-CTERM domain-containing protein [Paenibacillus rhizovicinus]